MRQALHLLSRGFAPAPGSAAGKTALGVGLPTRRQRNSRGKAIGSRGSDQRLPGALRLSSLSDQSLLGNSLEAEERVKSRQNSRFFVEERRLGRI
jgi:hypothetical protein